MCKKHSHPLFLSLLLTILLCSFPSSRAHAVDLPVVGAAAPEFTLTAQDGQPVRLGDFRGRWVVLYFYPRDFTPGCTVEAKGFERDRAHYEAANAAVLGVSVDSVDSHEKFCAEEGLNFKLLSDGDGAVSALYGSLRRDGPLTVAGRNTFIIDPAGTVARVFTAVAPAAHSAEVLAALSELREPPEPAEQE